MSVHATLHFSPNADGSFFFHLPEPESTVVLHIPVGHKIGIVTAYSQDVAGEDKFLIAITRKGENVQKDQTE